MDSFGGVWKYLKYLHAGSQSNRKKHQQTGLFKEVEKNQQRTETAPQYYKTERTRKMVEHLLQLGLD